MSCSHRAKIRATCLGAVFFLVAYPAGAQQAENLERCITNAWTSDEIDFQIKACTEVIESSKENSSNLVSALKGRGALYLGKLDYLSALSDFTQAIAADPTDATAYNDRGYAYFREGSYDDAIADYSKAIQIDSKAGWFDYRGDAYFHKGDFDNAIIDYTKAISGVTQHRFGKSHADLLLARGNTYFLKKDYDHAIADYTAAHDAEPPHSFGVNVQSLFARGVAYFAKNDYNHAISDFDAVLAIGSTANNALSSNAAIIHARALYGRGMSKIKLGDSLGGSSDTAAAKAVSGDVAESMAGLGVK
jgi:tetratricopeptide (TPR) repeat protein